MQTVSDYLYHKASINKIPLNGGFELSPICNFACKMCYVRKTPAQLLASGKRLKHWTEWLALAKACREAGTLYLLLTGGEPFLYPDFKKLYEELHKLGFLLSINSNGTMIDKETVEWLKRAAPARINITLYGASPETYARICGNAAGFARAKEAVCMLKEAGIPVVINASMIPENSADLEAIIAFGKEHDIQTRVATYMFPPVRREREESDSRFLPETAAKMYMRKYRCIFSEEEFAHFCWEQTGQKEAAEQAKEEADWGTDGEYMRCRAGRSSFWIAWDGAMTACGMTPFPIVSYPSPQEFKACWERLTEKVRTTPVLEECAGCSKRQICNPCVAMLYAETGQVHKKAPYLCEMTDCIFKYMEKIKETDLKQQ